MSYHVLAAWTPRQNRLTEFACDYHRPKAEVCLSRSQSSQPLCLTIPSAIAYNPQVPTDANVRLARVEEQLRLYEHPLLIFSAREKGEAVEVMINVRSSVPVHTYIFELHPRDLDSPQFEWQFQRQLYDCLHDYFIEMFIRTPQDRTERQA